MAADILVNGADPATTPVKTFDNGIAKVNIDVVTELGLDMTKIREAFMPYCTEVSEIKTDKSFEK